jgi:hypothetical protein
VSNEDQNGNGSGGDDLALACDLDDWVFAGRGIFRVVERLGRGIPPFGSDQRAELAQLIAATDAEFDRLVATWQTVIRPALARHEGHVAPELFPELGDARHVVAAPPALSPEDYSDGYWIDHWAGGAAHLIALVEGLRGCIPPADEGVAWSITSFHLPRVDEQFARVLNAWRTAARPRLRKYERRPRRR